MNAKHSDGKSTSVHGNDLSFMCSIVIIISSTG